MTTNEPDTPNRWKRLALGALARVRPLYPGLAWLFVVVVLYIFVGASLFPAWWKRFLLAGGLLEGRLWVGAFSWLFEALRAGHPLGLVAAALAVLLPSWFLYTCGRVGLRQLLSTVRAPGRGTVLLAAFVSGLTLLGLRLHPVEYLTPDEHRERLLAQLRGTSTTSLDQILHPRPPESGVFLYLDELRVARTYDTLQKDLTLALETTTTEGESEKHGAVDLTAFSGELVERNRIERSVQAVPTAPTPGRQASWLINTYTDLNILVDLPLASADDVESYEARSARKALADRGVALTSQQLEALKGGDAEILTRLLSRANTPLIYRGPIELRAEGTSLTIAITTGGGARVTISAIANLADLDSGMRSCAGQALGCSISASLLGVVWRTQRAGPAIKMEIIPLALW